MNDAVVFVILKKMALEKTPPPSSPESTESIDFSVLHPLMKKLQNTIKKSKNNRLSKKEHQEIADNTTEEIAEIFCKLLHSKSLRTLVAGIPDETKQSEDFKISDFYAEAEKLADLFAKKFEFDFKSDSTKLFEAFNDEEIIVLPAEKFTVSDGFENTKQTLTKGELFT
mgnify:CR=1 FL=1